MWVSWLFLAAALVGAFFTFNAFKPLRRPWPVVGFGFMGSWITGELIPHHIFWEAVATGLFWWAGALDHWPGWVALAVTLVSWSGLVYLHVAAMGSKGEVERALRDGLGEGYRDEIAPDLAARLDERFSLRQRLLPLPMYDRRVERVRDLAYTHVHGRDFTLDLYRRKDHPTGCPTLLQIHGGAWMIGSKKEQALPLMLRLAAHGWVCVSIDYRLSPWATFPDHEVDVKAALRWLRAHGPEYGADPDFVVITGGSAGGHLSALAALTPNDPEYQPGFEAADTTVQAAVPFYGVYDFTDRKGIWKGSPLPEMLERHVFKESIAERPELFDRASPISRVHPDAPPFLVIHGTNDVLSPVDEARHFVEQLRAVSDQPVCHVELSHAQHAFEVFPSARTAHVIRGVERFCAWVYTRHRAARAVVDAA
ncbi:MAG: alpha/beta hydrolase [Acidimicrobiales bacterium]|nr:alpha/beta hydrolase [Acidimicrobiales bacterium]